MIDYSDFARNQGCIFIIDQSVNDPSKWPHSTSSEHSTEPRVVDVFVHWMNRGTEMFKPIISKPIIRMAAAACFASAAGLAITASRSANEPGRQVQGTTTQPYASANPGRLRVPMKGNVCSVHGWLNFEPKCQFDLREPADEARTVRVLALP
jgi:hypothetical protein